MCFSRFDRGRPFDYSGDEILHDTVVPSRRPIPGVAKKLGDSYLVDVRGFLVTQNDANVKRVLERKIAPYSRDRVRFAARKKGAFDFRADVISRWVGEHILYASDKANVRRDDLWLFPDETLHLGSGDCEDRALLLASLMTASGISPYNVRVALGRIVFRDGPEEVAAYDHAWVAYKRENGIWEVLEPHEKPEARRQPANAREARLLRCTVEYEPAFVFNGEHLWRVREVGGFAKRVARRASWNRIDPRFLGDVHYTLIDDALRGFGVDVVTQVRRSFGHYLGYWVENVDLPGNYDPIDHMDNCFIAEGWQRVQSRLATFATRQDLEAFGLAAHGIADFYAHSSYGHFARVEGARYRSFDPAWLPSVDSELARPARYDVPDFDITGTRFTRGPRWGGRPGALAAELWNGQLVSGRYAHVRDSHSFFERFTWMPDALWNRKDMADRAGVPHHDEIAVDSRGGKNALYSARRVGGVSEYATQFDRRYATAVEHVRAAFKAGWQRG